MKLDLVTKRGSVCHLKVTAAAFYTDLSPFIQEIPTTGTFGWGIRVQPIYLLEEKSC